VKIKTAYFASATLGAIAVAAFLFYARPFGSSGSGTTKETKPLVVGFGFNTPPYMIAGKGESVDPYAPGAKHGIDPDLFKAALADTGRTFAARGESLGHIALDVSSGAIDAAVVSMIEPKRTGLYYSKKFRAFENVVITRKASNLTIRSYADLKGKSISAWQGAVGQHDASYFDNLVNENPHYSETADQAAQYRMMADHRVDALVMDKYIFLWWQKQDPKREEVVFHPVLPNNPFCIAFRDRELRDAFDEGLERIADSGERDRIFSKYIGEISSAGSTAPESSPGK
jgi:polar amino acid transport system substrate-binding protein